MKTPQEIMADHAARRKQLAKDNHDAPADTIIRAIFEHFDFIRDDEDGHVFESADECIDNWYNLDIFDIVFNKKDSEKVEGRCDYWIRLIHQNNSAHPSIEDVSDYTLSLEKTPIGPLLKEEHYPERYCI